MKKRLLFSFFCFYALALVSQESRDQRTFYIPAGRTQQTLDTLSIRQESFRIAGPDGLPLDRAFYEVDFWRASIRLRVPDFWQYDSLRVSYQVWPVNFSLPIFLRDTSEVRLPGLGDPSWFQPVSLSPPRDGLVRMEGLQSSGSITRGITVGNNQNAGLNSAMNLQLSGRISEDLSILAVISDQNIPFQPEGTTRQIQDFDKVFIRISGLGASLTAGDLELERPSSHFMHFNRKARGGMITYQDTLKKGALGGGRMETVAAGAVARGKYARNQIRGGEGNQGPYRLSGSDNESLIMILAGSERVFLDGVPLIRGMDQDYVMDYNLGELTFMPSRLITADSRIVVEFEYAERNYARSLVFAGTSLVYEKASLRFNFFSERDQPNQPLFQSLSEDRRARMAAVGDSLHLAFDWNVDSTGFFNDRVMYLLTDSLGYDTVFVFSTNPELAVYQLGFTYVGPAAGNYRQISSAANGRVFQWVAPLDGVPQGTHEPIVLLVTPKSHRMVSMDGEIRLSSTTRAHYSYALSSRDVNLFSEKDKADDQGHALFVALDQQILQAPAWLVQSRISYEISGQHFRPLERYRSTEFERDWNLSPLVQSGKEQLAEVALKAQHKQHGEINFWVGTLINENDYRGVMQKLQSDWKQGRNQFIYAASLLNTEGSTTSSFYRHRAAYIRSIADFQLGVIQELEDNQQTDRGNSFLSLSSAGFSQWEFFWGSLPDRTHSWRLFHKQRINKLPQGSQLDMANQSSEYGVQYRYGQNPNHRLGVQGVYREVSQIRTGPGSAIPGSSLNGRLDYYSRWWNGVVTSNLFYQTSSGVERKREYIYLEVPVGQGVYVWNDYNGNGIMELDEFELAPFPNEANFIRVFVPTEDWVSTYATSLSENLVIEPPRSWQQGTAISKFISRFSNRLNYRVDKKNAGGLSFGNLNPLISETVDSVLIAINASFRNSLFYNRTNPVYGFEWVVLENRNKNLLSNGFESRWLRSHGLRARWRFAELFVLQLQLNQGQTQNTSEFFVNRNYQIHFFDSEPNLSYQPGNNLRLSVFYGYSQKHNKAGTLREQAVTQSGGVETRYNIPGRGHVNGRFQLSHIRFPFPENTPLAFEMLQALSPGVNTLWNLAWQQNLQSYLQLTLAYNGRKPPGLPAIHTGTVQLRAFF